MMSSDERQRLFEKAWLDWRGSLTSEDLEGDPRDLVSIAFRVAWGEGLAASQARERALAEALEWIRDGIDQMYSETNEHGMKHLPPALAPHAGLISGLHKTATIALASAGEDAR